MSDLSNDDLDRLKSHAQYGHLAGEDYDAIELLVSEVLHLRRDLKWSQAHLGAMERVANDGYDAAADRDELLRSIERHRNAWMETEGSNSDPTLGNPEFDPFAELNERLWDALEDRSDR